MWSDDYGRDDDRNRRGGRSGDRRDRRDRDNDPNDQQWQSRSEDRGYGRDPGYQGPQWNPIYGNQSRSGGGGAGRREDGNPQFGQSGYGRRGFGPRGSGESQRSLGERDDPYQRYSPPQYPDSRDGGESFSNPYDRERQGEPGSIWGGADSRYTGGQGGYGAYTGGHSAYYRDDSPRGFRNAEYRGNSAGGEWQWSDERGGDSRNDYRHLNSGEGYRSQAWPESQGQYGRGWYSDPSRQPGPHQGRGPKGWKRSDDRIKEDINEQLSRHPHVDASDIEVKVEQGEVTLSGTVDDRYAKRMAEDAAEQVYGVTDVQNQIRVSRGGGDRTRSHDSWTSAGDRDVSRPPEREGRAPTDVSSESRSRMRGPTTGSAASGSTSAHTGAGGRDSTSTAGGSSGNT